MDLAGAGGSSRRVVEPPPATPPHGDVTHLPDARSTTRGPSAYEGSAVIIFDEVLYLNSMVSAAHQQARRDMATQTEETILAPELGDGHRVLEPLPATPHGDASSSRRLSAYEYFDVLYHNRMVSAGHQQARRDMATLTEETILAPEYGDGGGGGCSGTTPASTAAVARLEKRRHGAGGGDEGGAAVRCAICIEDFEAGEDLSVMPCSHLFHEGCIAKWLARSRLCPYCRHALPDWSTMYCVNNVVLN